MMEGKIDQAEKSYHLAIRNTEFFPDAKLLFSWARILEAKGETPTAVAAYQRAALIDPTDEGDSRRNSGHWRKTTRWARLQHCHERGICDSPNGNHHFIHRCRCVLSELITQ